MGAQNIQTFDLPGVVDVDAMDAMRELLLGAIEHGDIELDGSRVSRVATNALLMLVSAGQSAGASNFAMRIVNPSEALTEAIDRLGMGDIFSQFIEGS